MQTDLEARCAAAEPGGAPADSPAAALAPTDELAALADLADVVRDAVLICARDEVVHANEAAATMLGRAGDSVALRGCRLAALLTPAPLAEQAAGGAASSARILGLRQERWASVRSRDCGEFVVHVLTEQTERDRRRAARAGATRHFHETRADSAVLRSRLEAEVEERRELVSVVAHELRTPITVIRGYARLLLAGEVGELNPTQAGFIEESVRSCDRLDDFVEMLLRATDAQRAAEAYHFADASVATLLGGVVDFMRPLIDEAGCCVELELDPEALWGHFDSARIEQVLVNLISNGLKYAAGGGVLTLRTRPAVLPARSAAPATIEISVSDAGPGIESAHRARVFDPYVRGAAAAEIPGLGLGLAICRRIVEAHGGSIAVREEPGGGCCFAFTLIAAEPKDPVDHPESGDR